MSEQQSLLQALLKELNSDKGWEAVPPPEDYVQLGKTQWETLRLYIHMVEDHGMSVCLTASHWWELRGLLRKANRIRIENLLPFNRFNMGLARHEGLVSLQTAVLNDASDELTEEAQLENAGKESMQDGQAIVWGSALFDRRSNCFIDTNVPFHIDRDLAWYRDQLPATQYMSKIYDVQPTFKPEHLPDDIRRVYEPEEGEEETSSDEFNEDRISFQSLAAMKEHYSDQLIAYFNSGLTKTDAPTVEFNFSSGHDREMTTRANHYELLKRMIRHLTNYMDCGFINRDEQGVSGNRKLSPGHWAMYKHFVKYIGENTPKELGND